MKIAYFTGLGELEIREAPMPTIQRPDDVLVRIDRVGVCGSDVHYYRYGRIGDQVITYPATLGHECSGTIVEVGRAVTSVEPGDRVAVEPAISCGQCDQCLAGRANTCRKLQFLGCPGEAPGACAEFHVLRGQNCFPVPRTITLDQAALIEPLSIGLYAARLGTLAEGAKIAILGAGPIGLSVLLCAKETSRCKAYVTDLLDERLKVAQTCGADWTGNAKRDDVTAAIEQREPLGLEVVFECSGDPECVNQAQRMLTPGGTLVLVGIPPVPEIHFDSHRMRRQELTFKNVRRQIDCVGPVIEMIAQGRIDPNPMLTHRFPLSEIRDAFELVASYRDGVIKAIIELSTPE